MNKIILSFLVGAMAAVVQAATYHVTPDAPAGSNGSGSSWANAITIDQLNKKIESHATGDIVLFKSGVYKPTSRIVVGYKITFKGGLAGIDGVTLDSNGAKSVFDGQNSNSLDSLFYLVSGGLVTFENIEFRNAYQRAVDKFTTAAGSLLFKKCVFDSCGRNWVSSISAVDGTSSLRGAAGRFFGASTATLSFEDCVFSRNMYEEY